LHPGPAPQVAIGRRAGPRRSFMEARPTPASSHWPPATRSRALSPGSPVGVALDRHSAISRSAQELAKKRRAPCMKMTPESEGVAQEDRRVIFTSRCCINDLLDRTPKRRGTRSDARQ